MEQIRIECQGADVIAIDNLTEFQGDLKELTKQNYEKFKDDILTLGFSSPIHVWKSDKNYILDGHQRLKTLQTMRDEGFEIPQIPIVWVEAKDFKTAKKKVLSLTSQFGTMTEKGLKQFMESAKLDLDEVTKNFTFAEIDFKKFAENQFPDNKKNENDPDDVPTEAKEVYSKPGEIYQLGDHRLAVGDMLDKELIARLMDGKQADLVVTDPPYNVEYEGKTKEKLTIENDSMDDQQFKAWLLEVFNCYRENMKEGAPIYVFHADLFGEHFRGSFVKSGLLLKQVCIWVKDTIVMGRSDYHWKHEPILYGWKKGAGHPWHSDRKQSTVWNFDRPKKNTEHPTMKPISLIEYPVENSSAERELVIDFFGGSGSTMIAAEKTNRVCYMSELDPRYADVILNRWSQYTELDPFRVNEDGSETYWSEINGY